MLNYPHSFPSLTESDGVKPVLLVGAGLSYGIIPTIPELTEEIQDRHKQIEGQLGCCNLDEWDNDDKWKNDGALYQWAEDVVSALSSTGTRNEAKKKLVEKIGITDDLRFHGKVDVPLRGNTPRHRVIARFAREGRWYSFWILNWDCLIEVALESVGLTPLPDGSPKKTLPWPEWYRTWAPDEDIPPNPHQESGSTVHVIKPHGCVRKLVSDASSTFKICAPELKDPLENTDDNTLFNRHFLGNPILASGWSGEDRYLIKRTILLARNNALQTTNSIVDKFSVINRSWRIGHARLARCCRIQKKAAFFEVAKNEKPLLDEFFLWLQTRFGLNALRKVHNCATLQEYLNQFQQPHDHWINYWFDDFLPVWTRLCFNVGWVKFVENSRYVSIEAVPTDRRDEHIPWGHRGNIRIDMKAASHLLCKLKEHGDQWNYGKYSGGLWQEKKGLLILPLPYFETGEYLSLGALKQLIERRHWENHGMIRDFKILPMNADGDISSPKPGIAKMIKQRVASLMKNTQWAVPHNIGLATFDDLEGGA